MKENDNKNEILIYLYGYLLIIFGIVLFIFEKSSIYKNFSSINPQWITFSNSNDLMNFTLMNKYLSYLMFIVLGIFIVYISRKYKTNKFIIYEVIFLLLYFALLTIKNFFLKKDLGINEFFEIYIHSLILSVYSLIIVFILVIMFVFFWLYKKRDYQKKERGLSKYFSIIFVVLILLISVKSIKIETKFIERKNEIEQSYIKTIKSLKLGMTKLEVISILGIPNNFSIGMEMKNFALNSDLQKEDLWIYLIKIYPDELIKYEKRDLIFKNNILKKIK